MTVFNLKGRHEQLAIAVHHKIRTTLSFYVVVLQGTVKKCTKIQSARAKPLLCSLNFLFGDILVAVAVVVC